MPEKAKTAFEKFQQLAKRVVNAPKPPPEQKNEPDPVSRTVRF